MEDALCAQDMLVSALTDDLGPVVGDPLNAVT